MEQHFNEKYGVDISIAGWKVLEHEDNFVDFNNKTMYCNDVRHLDFYINLNSWGNSSINTFFTYSDREIIMKPIMRELFELIYHGWSYLTTESMLVVLNAKNEIKHVKELTSLGFTDMGKSNATPLLIKNGLMKNDKIYYHFSEVDIVMFSENDGIAIPFNTSSESRIRYTEIISDMPHELIVHVHQYNKFKHPTSILYTIRLSKNHDLTIMSTPLSLPSWMDSFNKHVKMFKTPCNKHYWYLLVSDTPKYEGNKLFVTSSLNYYILINNIWIETTEYWLFNECLQDSDIKQEYDMYRQIETITIVQTIK